MSGHDPELEVEYEREHIELERPKRAGGVISVRFNAEEMRELREETRATGERAGTLIRESTLAAIRSRRLNRGLTRVRIGSSAQLERTIWARSLNWKQPKTYRHPSSPEVTSSIGAATTSA